MTTKEKILAEVNKLTDEQLEDLYIVLQRYMVARQMTPTNFLKQLSQIQIDAPEDFATTLDHYLRRDTHL